MFSWQALGIPFQTYFSVTKYDVMGTIPRHKLNIMSFARTPLYKRVKLEYWTWILVNVLMSGLRYDFTSSSLVAHLCKGRRKRASTRAHATCFPSILTWSLKVLPNRTMSSHSEREIHPLTIHESDTKGSSPNGPHFSWIKWDLTPSEWDILVVSTCIKMLLFPA